MDEQNFQEELKGHRNSSKQEPMTDLTERIAGLSPAKRALLEMRLKNKSPGASGERMIPRRVTQEPVPLSFSQQRLWFLHQLEPDSPVYNIARAMRLNGALNVEALRKTLDTIVARHEILRTTITAVDGNPVQVVAENGSVELSLIDLSEKSDAYRQAEMHRFLNTEAQRPFNLASDLLLRATLLRLRKEEHVLFLTTHHIASDGWSSGILMQELTTLYRAFSLGNSCTLPELPIQYADFAGWQRQWLRGEILEGQLSYWKRQLSNAPAMLELPTDRPRPSIQSFRGARQLVKLPMGLTDALKKLSQREGVTLFMTLLAAFKTLLSRYTRQDDILVGVPVANRTRPETEKLIGFFVNNLVLRTDLSGSPTFRELLGRVREVALGGYAHQDLPFEKLVEELQPERDLSRTPLFQVMFGFQSVRRETPELPGLTLSPIEMESGTAKFDLFLSMVEEGDSLRGSLEYNTDLFEDGTITRMLGHFHTLLEGVTAHPEQRLWDLPILTERERQQLLVEWNDTGKDYAKDKCIHQLFESQVDRTPDATAVVFPSISLRTGPSTGSGHSEDKQLTYRELNHRANQLAHHLRALGVGPEVRVAIFVERSLEMVIGLLGILKAGGAYVPLDPAYPKERLAFMLEDAEAPVLLTQEGLLQGLPDHRGRVVRLDSDWHVVAQESRENPTSRATAESLAYVIYTSGSTGKPKGVVITHRALVNFFNSMWQQPGLACEDTLLSVTTLSFDIAALEIFLPLTVGARVVVASRAVAADGVQLREKLERYGVTAMQATPATWRLLLEAGWQGARQLKILCGGEALQGDLATDLLAGGSSLWNMYGPTETTIWSSVHPVGLLKNGPVPIGRPISNTEIYIFDPYFQPVPIGVPGELFIGGVGLARGYLNRPELTAERFVPDPHGERPGARLYKTGDLARYLPDGSIEFLGRVDHQVKIRGFRIELGEIEAVLGHYPSVREAILLAREDVPGQRRLVAYVVTSQKPAPTAAELRSFLKEKLPDYMVPSVFVFLEALPLTPNGKVDRRALPPPDQTRPDAEKTFMAPRDELELQLIKIWEKILDVTPIGVNDNFFDLGGHSLLAVRLFAQIEKISGKKLPLATLFQAPTVEQLASILRQEGWTPPWSSLVAIQPNGSRPPFFCVHAHGGNVLIFNDLARRLGSDQPFYGLQAQGLDGQQNRHTGIEEMAAHYIQEIRTVQPTGPYFLGGYCFGGKVAFEMAHQLHAEGHKVTLLAVIDSYAPGYPKLLPWVQRKVKERVSYHWGNLKPLGTKQKLDYFLTKGGIVKSRIETGIKEIVCKLYLTLRLPLPPHLKEAQETKRKSTSPYVPKVYLGRIVVFPPSQGPESHYHDLHMGWHGLAAEGVDIHEVPGSFASIILEPCVQVLAKKLGECLENAQAATR